jgi:hypothetical protein
VKVRVFGVVTVLAACSVPLVLIAAPRSAPQPVSGQQPAASQVDQIRFQISVMEGVLQSAAENGARQTAQELKNIVPDGVLWSGAPRARGFRLDNYGYFFDVEIPALRGSVAWSIEVLDRNQTLVQEQLSASLQALRGQIQRVTDAGAREQLTQTLQRIELQVRSDAVPADAARSTTVSTTPARPAKPADPIELYTTRVKDALIDAILDHSAPLPVRPDEWLTIAARGSQIARVGIGETDDLTTVFLRIRGSDLAAFHAGRLNREEVRNRVEVREF